MLQTFPRGSLHLLYCDPNSSIAKAVDIQVPVMTQPRSYLREDMSKFHKRIFCPKRSLSSKHLSAVGL